MTVGGQTFTVTQGALQLAALSLSPASVAGGQAPVGELPLDAPAPDGGVVVTLSSSDPAVASAPASVAVAAGATSQTFGVTTLPVEAVRLFGAKAAGETVSAAARVEPA